MGAQTNPLQKFSFCQKQINDQSSYFYLEKNIQQDIFQVQ